MPAQSSVPLRGAPQPFHHKASGQAAVKVRGRFYYCGKWNTQAAADEYARIIRDVWSKPPAEPPEGLTPSQLDKLTIRDLVFAYRKHCEQRYVKDGQPTSTIAGIAPAMRMLRESFGDQLAADFGPLKLQALRRAWIEDGSAAGGKGLSRTTVNHYTAYVKRLFYWAAKNELVPASVAHGLQFVEHLAEGENQVREPDPISAVEDDLVDATLQHLSAIVADMVCFQRLTGARPGEVCKLYLADVKRYADQTAKSRCKAATLPLSFGDDVAAALRVKLDVWEWRPRGHKMAHKKRSRVVMIGPRAQVILDGYLAKAGEGKCFPYTVAAYRRAIARAVVRAFMPEHLRTISRKLPPEERALLKRDAAAWRAAHVWSPNQLRHSAATAIEAHYGSDDAARVVLGHKSKTTTEQYLAQDLAKARNIAREVG
jgi:integrase